MTKDKLNVLANALLDVLPPEGMPEGYLALAAEQAGCHPTNSIAMLIDLGLLERLPGYYSWGDDAYAMAKPVAPAARNP